MRNSNNNVTKKFPILFVIKKYIKKKLQWVLENISKWVTMEIMHMKMCLTCKIYIYKKIYSFKCIY